MINVLGITFHLYGLIIGIAVILAFEVSRKLAIKRDVNERFVEGAFYWTVSLGLLGARLYHVLDYWERYYSKFPIRVFYIWEGGLAIWGAVVGGFIGLWIFWRLKNKRVDFWGLTDIGVVGLPLAQAIGRLGNLTNGELYGKDGQPLFAYEGVLNLLLFALLWKISAGKKTGILTGVYLVGYGAIRIVLENFRSEKDVWRVAGAPMAMIFGVIAVMTGLCLISRKQS